MHGYYSNAYLEYLKAEKFILNTDFTIIQQIIQYKNDIIIYHHFFPHQGGVAMSSQIAHTQSFNIYPIAHILDT